MGERIITVISESFPDADALDTAVSRAMLLDASEGRIGESFRIHRPGRVVAFGKHDTITDGFDAAVEHATAAGFLPVVRLAGGRAALFHEGTLAFTWTIPADDPTREIRQRFAMLAELMVRAFRRLGADARVGEVPGEYCPGEFSVNLDGTIKVMGVGQRLARHAAHVGGVVVVHASQLVNDVLTPIYTELGLDMDPEATGAIEDRIPSVTTDQVIDAVMTELAELGTLQPGKLAPETFALARSMAPTHVAVPSQP